MSKSNIETLHGEIEVAMRDARAASYMGSRALMSLDYRQPRQLEEFSSFARDFHEIVYTKLDDLEEKVRELVAATKN